MITRTNEVINVKIGFCAQNMASLKKQSCFNSSYEISLITISRFRDRLKIVPKSKTLLVKHMSLNFLQLWHKTFTPEGMITSTSFSGLTIIRANWIHLRLLSKMNQNEEHQNPNSENGNHDNAKVYLWNVFRVLNIFFKVWWSASFLAICAGTGVIWTWRWSPAWVCFRVKG